MLFVNREIIDVLQTKLIGYTRFESIYNNLCNVDAIIIRTILYNDRTIKYTVHELVYAEIDVVEFLKQVDNDLVASGDTYSSQEFDKYEDAITFAIGKYKLKSKFEIIDAFSLDEYLIAIN